MTGPWRGPPAESLAELREQLRHERERADEAEKLVEFMRGHVADLARTLATMHNRSYLRRLIDALLGVG